VQENRLASGDDAGGPLMPARRETGMEGEEGRNVIRAEKDECPR